MSLLADELVIESFDRNGQLVFNEIARTTNGATVIAYVPSQKEITVDLRRITGGEVKAWWFNPREGSAQLIGTFPTTGSQAFTPAASGDWVLVLDNASLDLPPPGGSVGVRPRQTDGRSEPAATDRTPWQSNL